MNGHCCKIGCDKAPTKRLHGLAYLDYTEACDDHAAELMPDDLAYVEIISDVTDRELNAIGSV